MESWKKNYSLLFQETDTSQPSNSWLRVFIGVHFIAFPIHDVAHKINVVCYWNICPANRIQDQLDETWLAFLLWNDQRFLTMRGLACSWTPSQLSTSIDKTHSSTLELKFSDWDMGFGELTHSYGDPIWESWVDRNIMWPLPFGLSWTISW